MDPDQEYHIGKKLLKEHFGNEYMIAVAFMNKALSTIKAVDSEALSALALFLTSYRNAMVDR